MTRNGRRHDGLLYQRHILFLSGLLWLVGEGGWQLWWDWFVSRKLMVWRDARLPTFYPFLDHGDIERPFLFSTLNLNAAFQRLLEPQEVFFDVL